MAFRRVLLSCVLGVSCLTMVVGCKHSPTDEASQSSESGGETVVEPNPESSAAGDVTTFNSN